MGPPRRPTAELQLVLVHWAVATVAPPQTRVRSKEPWFCGLCHRDGIHHIINARTVQYCQECKVHKGRGERPAYGKRVDFVIMDRDHRYDVEAAETFMGVGHGTTIAPTHRQNARSPLAA